MKLLTHPMAAGYIQNPISVYYCYNAAGRLSMCIAEVTNTPWCALLASQPSLPLLHVERWRLIVSPAVSKLRGERVTFLFRPGGEDTPKALHVSPLMDMKGVWCAMIHYSRMPSAESWRSRHQHTPQCSKSEPAMS